MKPAVIFELCAETIEACRAAAPGGADRIELCRALEVDGLTPSDALVRLAIAESDVPVHVLVRPEADDFRYTSAKFDATMWDALRVADLRPAGLVMGMLNEDRTVDVEHTRELVAAVAPLPVSFHRAFDATPDLSKALEDVIASGCYRVLTSGGAPDVLRGAAALDALVSHAAGRISIAAGGGIRLSNAKQLAESWGGWQYHGTLGGAAAVEGLTLAERIRRVKEELRT